MRNAKKADFWRAVQKGAGGRVSIEKVEYANVPGIGCGVVRFKTPVNLLCGPNGVGKTTLLRSIGAALHPEAAVRSPSTRFRLRSGKVDVHVVVGGEAQHLATDLSSLENCKLDKPDYDLVHIDTSSVISDLQDYFCKFPDIDDALNGEPTLEANSEAIETLSYLTNIRYREVVVHNIEEAIVVNSGDDDEIIGRPFFRVQTATAAYDCRTMGLGELAACYLWWSLERVSDNSILLIEEPESFLSPMCQSAFASILAMYAAKKKPFIIITTHSSQIIQSAPKECVRFLYRNGQNLALSEEPIEVLLRTVGIDPVVQTLVLVEDAAALNFAKLWIAHFAPDKVQSIEFILMKGEGGIARVLAALPQNEPKIISLIGLYDGDAEAKGKAANRVAFLPGQKPVEALYREMLDNEADRVLGLLQIENLPQILSAIQGQELHEWFEQLRQHSNLTSQQLHFVLFKAWIAKEENRALGEKYFGQIRAEFDSD